MDKLLVINNTNKATEWFLGTVQTKGIQKEVYVVQQETCIYLGIQFIVKMILKWGIQHANQYSRVYELNKALDYYYNCLAIDKIYIHPNSMDGILKQDLENYINQEEKVIKFLQQKGTLELKLGEEHIKLFYASFEQTILKDIQETFKDVLNEWMQVNISELPRQVVLKGVWSKCEWYEAIVKDVLKCTIVSYEHLEVEKKQMIDQLTNSSKRNHSNCMIPKDEIILRYLDKEIILLNASQIEDSKFNGEYTLSIAFSLHPHITVDILKRYKQEGRYKYEMLASTNIFHPLFYTGDEMKVVVNRELEGYRVKFIHVETKLERSVLVTYRK